MVQLVVLAVGLLLIAESEASDVGDSSTLQGFLSKNDDYDKFITPNLNRVKPVSAKDFDSPKIADREDAQAAQLLTDNSYDTISLSVFGIGLVSFVTMLGLTLWRALQPATIPTNSGGLDMPMMEMKTQDSNVKASSSRVGWGPLSSQSAQPQTLCYATKADMAALAKANPDKIGQLLGLWDPLNLLEKDFWDLGNEATIGYLRHAEIKHGRVAMAAFLGYIAGSTDLVSNSLSSNVPGITPGLTPPQQWDAMTWQGKLQIVAFIGLAEWYGEILPEHYTKGGLPGKTPWYPSTTFKQDKARGRQCEINNGRLAMLGIFGFLAESKAPGSVPALQGLIPEYSGDYMVPFEGSFSFFNY
jgi:hypothetical protein